MSTGRRPNGEGSIFWREDKQRWIGVLDVTEDGRRVRRSVTARTKKQAAALLNQLRREHDQLGALPAADLTFGELLEAWFQTALPARVQPSTVKEYRSIADTHLTQLGKHKVAKLRPEHLERILMKLAAADYSKTSIIRVRMIACQILDWAVRRRAASWNPFRVSEMPAGVPALKNPRRPLTVEETRRVIAGAGEHRNGALIVVGLATGLRPGELLALTWDGVDLDAGTLHVWQAFKGSGDDRHLGETKTQGSVRTVALPPIAVEALRRHRHEQVQERLAGRWVPEHEDHGGLVFVTELGTPVDPANLRRMFRTVGTAAGVEGFTPYKTRHTFTSILADDGIPNEQLADLLGHRTTRMVELHYRHRLKTVVDVAAEPMQRILGG